jgi:hypothetical protein
MDWYLAGAMLLIMVPGLAVWAWLKFVPSE